MNTNAHGKATQRKTKMGSCKTDRANNTHSQMHHDSNRGACEWGTRGKLIFTAQSTMPVIPGWHAGKNPDVKI